MEKADLDILIIFSGIPAEELKVRCGEWDTQQEVRSRDKIHQQFKYNIFLYLSKKVYCCLTLVVQYTNIVVVVLSIDGEVTRLVRYKSKYDFVSFLLFPINIMTQLYSIIVEN